MITLNENNRIECDNDLHIGSGIRRIRTLCREYDVAEPNIEVSENWFTIIFPRPVKEVHESKEATDLNQDGRQFVNGYETLEAGSVPSLSPVCPKSVPRGLREHTIPDKPNSSKQKYRLSDLGRKILLKMEKEKA